MEGKATPWRPPSEPGSSAVGAVEGTRWQGGLCRYDPLQVAILVPFRNRHEHLPVLLRHLIPMLQRQRLQFAFYVVEQVSGSFFSLLSLPRLQSRECQADPSLGLRAHKIENSWLSGSVWGRDQRVSCAPPWCSVLAGLSAAWSFVYPWTKASCGLVLLELLWVLSLHFRPRKFPGDKGLQVEMAVLFFLPCSGLGTLLNAITQLTLCLQTALGERGLGLYLIPFFIPEEVEARGQVMVSQWWTRQDPPPFRPSDLSVSSLLGRAEAAKILLQESFKNKVLLLLGWHPTL